uniref:IL17RA/B N-terminal domain-containing protein n=1 Tax=Pygocentrus nattereri TaxID=42514 RepID=A0A3B4C390_PYGNA
MRSLVLLLLVHLADTGPAPGRVAKCSRTQDLMPTEWYEVYDFTPSALRDLDLKLNLQNGPTASPSLTISWSINIDSSIHNITGTWIELNIRSLLNPDPVRYRCDYQPPFSSPADYAGLEQLWFSFTSTDVNIEPAGFYKVDVYNLPSPPIDMGGKHSKAKEVQAPGCDNTQMRTQSVCSVLRDMDIYAVPEGEEIVVSFQPHSYYEIYDILLQRNAANLNRIKVQTDGKIWIEERLKYSGPCENLRISVRPSFKNCGVHCKWIWREIDCTSKCPILLCMMQQ